MFITAFLAVTTIVFSQMQPVQFNSQKMVFNDGGDFRKMGCGIFDPNDF